MWKLLRRSIAFWFGLALIASGLTLVPGFMEKKREFDRFLNEGRVTDAPVLERLKGEDAEGNPTYVLDIQYYDEALNQYPRKLTVDAAIGEKYPRGSSLPVRYLTTAPEKMIPEPAMSTPEWKDLRRTATTFALMGGIVALLAALKSLRLAGRMVDA